MKIKELLSDESKWIKNNIALNANEEVRAATSKDAIKWCLLGALQKCYHKEVVNCNKIYDKIEEFIYPKAIHQWNDSNEITFSDVKNLLEKLDV